MGAQLCIGRKTVALTQRQPEEVRVGWRQSKRERVGESSQIILQPKEEVRRRNERCPTGKFLEGQVSCPRRSASEPRLSCGSLCLRQGPSSLYFIAKDTTRV
jgi:hypothetical protein